MKELIKLLKDCRYPIEHIDKGNHSEKELLERIDDMVKELELVKNLTIPDVMLRFSDDEKKLNIDGLHDAIAVCDWDNYDKEEYENPKAQISWYYSLIAKLNEA